MINLLEILATMQRAELGGHEAWNRAETTGFAAIFVTHPTTLHQILLSGINIHSCRPGNTILVSQFSIKPSNALQIGEADVADKAFALKNYVVHFIHRIVHPRCVCSNAATLPDT